MNACASMNVCSWRNGSCYFLPRAITLGCWIAPLQGLGVIILLPLLVILRTLPDNTNGMIPPFPHFLIPYFPSSLLPPLPPRCPLQVEIISIEIEHQGESVSGDRTYGFIRYGNCVSVKQVGKSKYS